MGHLSHGFFRAVLVLWMDENSCTTWKPWGTIVYWYLRGNHHSRVSQVVQDFDRPQYVQLWFCRASWRSRTTRSRQADGPFGLTDGAKTAPAGLFSIAPGGMRTLRYFPLNFCTGRQALGCHTLTRYINGSTWKRSGFFARFCPDPMVKT